MGIASKDLALRCASSKTLEDNYIELLGHISRAAAEHTFCLPGRKWRKLSMHEQATCLRRALSWYIECTPCGEEEWEMFKGCAGVVNEKE